MTSPSNPVIRIAPRRAHQGVPVYIRSGFIDSPKSGLPSMTYKRWEAERPQIQLQCAIAVRGAIAKTASHNSSPPNTKEIISPNVSHLTAFLRVMSVQRVREAKSGADDKENAMTTQPSRMPQSAVPAPALSASPAQQGLVGQKLEVAPGNFVSGWVSADGRFFRTDYGCNSKFRCR